MHPLSPTSLSPLAEILLGAQLLMALAYAERVRRGRGRAPAVDTLFAIAFAAGLVSLMAPGAFQPFAHAVLESTHLPAALREADARLEVVEHLPPAVWQELNERVGWPFDGEPPIEQIPLRGGRSLEERTVPALEAVIVRWTRTATWAASAFTILLAFLLRRGASASSLIRDLEERVSRLEEALEELQEPGPDAEEP